MCLRTATNDSYVSVYYIIIDLGINAPGHGKEVVDGINSFDKRYIYQLMSTVKLPVSKRFYFKIQICTVNQKYDVSLAKEFQEHLTKEYRKNGVFHRGKKLNNPWKENGQTDNIMFSIMLMLHTNM